MKWVTNTQRYVFKSKLTASGIGIIKIAAWKINRQCIGQIGLVFKSWKYWFSFLMEAGSMGCWKADISIEKSSWWTSYLPELGNGEKEWAMSPSWAVTWCQALCCCHVILVSPKKQRGTVFSLTYLWPCNQMTQRDFVFSVRTISAFFKKS